MSLPPIPRQLANGRPWIIRSGALGDTVMMTAVCEAVRERHACQPHIIGTGHWAEPIYRRCPAVDGLCVLDSMKTPWLFNPRKRQVLRLLRRHQPSAIYVCGGDAASLRLAQASGLTASAISTMANFPALADEHAVDHLLRFVGSGSRLPHLELSTSDQAEADAWRQRVVPAGRVMILVQPGNRKTMRAADQKRASNTKYWPEDRWSAVLLTLHQQRPDLFFVLCGTATERELAQEIVASLPADCHHVAAGDLPLPRLLGLATRATAMISVDTGPAHAAAAMGCPVLVLFGDTDPRVYLPRGPSPAVAVHACPDRESGAAWWREHHCMEDIQPAQVLAAWSELMARKPLPQSPT